ncbi:MAG: hypothetical protein QOH60_5154 [Mycobacterium sp.]|nr:hypothetical protein [Mycobacterium sp.]
MTVDKHSVDEMRDTRPHDHVVHVYVDDFALTQELARFVADGLTLGEAVVVAVTAEHRASVLALLDRRPLRAGARESLVILDAVETLNEIMVDGHPDGAVLEALSNRILDPLTADGREVRLCGEMVAMLWAEGNVTGALALESVWNDLAAKRRFFLMCAYPGASLRGSRLRDIDAMRDEHSQSWLLGLSMQYAERSAITTPDNAQLLIPFPMPSTVSVARHFATHTLAEWEAADLVDSAEVIASQLATNAVEHAHTAYRLTLSQASTTVRIEVEDAVPVADGASLDLAKVQACASRYGYTLTPHGKKVWAELNR